MTALEGWTNLDVMLAFYDALDAVDEQETCHSCDEADDQRMCPKYDDHARKALASLDADVRRAVLILDRRLEKAYTVQPGQENWEK